MIRIAILDLYEGQANQGMRCIRQIIREWSKSHDIETEWDEFDVRQKAEAPDLSYDIYISTGGPGSPLESKGSAWEAVYFNWLHQIEEWNAGTENNHKKHVFFICHSFQLVCRHFAIGNISQRNKTAFGVYPVHVTMEGQQDAAFRGMHDPFYVVDSRDYQVTSPDFETLEKRGSKILCIEKYRPHVDFEQAIMGIRFNEYMVGTQFHPEADASGMSMYLQTDAKKKTVIDNYGEEKWHSMVEQLNDPDKIMWTYAHILPNFLNEAIHQLQESFVD
ncbi:MAG: homoserine O-succinyltransferase [Bacteroidota bacterium]|nr:homoserine O-succinyltransferase [Bacteroidota bacterium]